LEEFGVIGIFTSKVIGLGRFGRVKGKGLKPNLGKGWIGFPKGLRPNCFGKPFFKTLIGSQVTNYWQFFIGLIWEVWQKLKNRIG